MEERLSRAWSLALTHPRLWALACGVLAAGGFPPLRLWPLALLGIAGFAALIVAACDWKHAARLGWLFGVAHFTFANNWIADAFTHQSEMPAFLGWIAVPLLSLYLAVYPAIAAGLARALAGPRPLALAFAFGGSWAFAEWLRSWVFTGYAWDPLGLVVLGAWDRQGLAALLPWLGTYALSGLVALIGAGIAVLLAKRAWLRAAAVLGLVGVAMILPGPAAQPGGLRVTLIQPGFQQRDLDDPAQYEDQFQALSALTGPRRDAGKRLVLWPESGLPDYLRPGYPKRYYLATTAGGDPGFARERIAQAIGKGSLLLTGAVDLKVEGGRAVGAYNAITALDDEGEFAGSYYKAHLVPYGEYLALRWLLEPLGATRLVAGTIDFIPGPGPRTIDLGAYGRAGMQICYEIVFAGQVVDRSNRPDYIFNPSNDGWFGAFGPPQHLAQARMRAIEEGLPVLRATVNGISAVIDARGIVRGHLPTSFKGGRIDAAVPPALAPTPFALFGNPLSLGWAGLMIALSLLVRRRLGG
ncbi:Apolipoprotein N-acyltransferase [Tsuneonella dongtanensis]|uniref:Apolipoprotein N-acyltransferase n=1 Tax=Tsuneonella dongtanensis TaxID=692370 RepID=A0A1B2A9K5_9SPHN|nr:apolipoprotein N-acyltransferase [Tsuneonella dongtanensis]ANY18735.1 Apolipoprotein N-acyltransferase [Tsuneonella dongtanensis]